MFGQHADEALDRAELRRVDHDRFTVASVRSGVFQSKTVRLVEVVLNSRHLPGTSDRVLRLNGNLRAVECSTTRIGNGIQTGFFCAATQDLGGFLPLFIGSDELVLLLSIGVAGRQLEVEVVQTEIAKKRQDEVQQVLNFITGLLGHHIGV